MPKKAQDSVLLVEDDEAVRRLLADFLRAEGFVVTEAPDGTVALELCKLNRLQPDFLVADVILPKMKGTELAQSLLNKFPNIKIVLMSGYMSEDNVQELAGPQLRFLHKPFVPSDLGNALSALKDAGPNERHKSFSFE